MKEIKCMNPSRGQLRQPGAPCFRGATTHKGCKSLIHSPQLFGHCPESPPGMATLQSRVSITVRALNFKVFIIAWGDVQPGFFLQDTATLTRNSPFWDLSLLGRFQTVASISENAACLFSGFLKRLHPHWPIPWVYNNWFCTVVPPTPKLLVMHYDVPRPGQPRANSKKKPKPSQETPHNILMKSCSVLVL